MSISIASCREYDVDVLQLTDSYVSRNEKSQLSSVLDNYKSKIEFSDRTRPLRNTAYQVGIADKQFAYHVGQYNFGGFYIFKN